MGGADERVSCITYLPIYYFGRGVARTCVNLVEHFGSCGLNTTVVLPKRFEKIDKSIDVREAIPFPVKGSLLWHLAEKIRVRAVDRVFSRIIDTADPKRTIAYFWPNPNTELVQRAKDRGLITVREMINTVQSTAKSILDEAYDHCGIPCGHSISAEDVESEQMELAEYDYIFAPSKGVECSLLKAGFSASKILRSSYGWSPKRFNITERKENVDRFRALFVGYVGVRKGIPQLLAAWSKSGIEGELWLAGGIEPAIQPLLKPYLESGKVRHFGFVSDLSSLYASADIFVFPSLEEGDPQVVYEAAGCGLAAVTTEMGAGNIVKDYVNGFVIQPYDLEGFAAALKRLADSPELRHRLSHQARMDANQFTFETVAKNRARMLLDVLKERDLAVT